MLVAPSILSANFDDLDNDIKKIEDVADFLHLDVMDNIFVPNKTFDYELIKSLRPKFKMIFDTHLMIVKPEEYIEKYAQCGSDYITFHYEATDNPKALIEKIKSYGIKAGISIKPGTDVHVLDDLLPYLDLILIMSVEPGFGGQQFMPNSIEKIDYLKKMKHQGYHYLIEVDGGINDKTIELVKNCDVVVAGSYVFKADDPKAKVNSLK